MLNDEQLKQHRKGQVVYAPGTPGTAREGRLYVLIPIMGRRTGRILKTIVQSRKSPSGAGTGIRQKG